ncbi:MAG: hypothetical protein LBO74_01285 [Candidatus Symbiothrix sp.]|nr:hypothetical protein [Candidatus Symbiothrix sp.]
MKQRTKRTWAACLAALWLVLPAVLQAQVHIGGTESAVKGALLDLTTPAGSNLGLLPLNVSLEDINEIPDVFTNKASITAGDLQGLIVYNINPDLPDGAGLYVWNGAKWSKIVSCTGAPTLGALTAATICNGSDLIRTADVVSDNGSPVTKYEWKLGGVTIDTSENLSYEVTADDNGKVLTLSVINACGTTTTAGVTLTVPAALTQPDPAAATICNGAMYAFTLAAATGGSGAISYNWQESTNGVAWEDAEGTRDEADYTVEELTETMYYRRQATAADCGGTIESASAKVTVNPAFTQPDPSVVTICNGATTTLTLAAATGGSGAITYNWQQSADDETWADAEGTRDGANYTTPALTTTMYYRRQAIAATCGGTINSASAEVTVNAAFTQPAPAAVSICIGSEYTFTLDEATGGSGAITYQWEQSVDNSAWANADGTSTDANYTTPALTSNMYYRRIATAATCGGTITSASALVTAATTATLTQPAPAAVTICSGTTTTFTLAAATGGSGAITYQWQQSANNSAWVNATGTSNTANYTTPALTGNMYYRRIATAATCGGSNTSAAALVTIAAALTQANPAAATICYNTTRAITLAVATGGAGTITYNWQQSADNSTWANAAGTRNAANYTTPALTSNMYYRRQATVCSTTITSASALITVTANFTQANPAAATICYNTTRAITLAVPTGGSGTITYNWQQSTDNATWANAAGTRNAANYTTPTLTTAMYYRRQAIAATCGGTITSASAKITVNANFTQANPAAATICYNTQRAITLAAATGGSGTITYNWQQSTDNSTWANAAGTRNAANYTTPALTTTMYYRRQAIAATCGGTITSASAKITVTANFTQANPAAATIQLGSTRTFTVAVPTGGSGTITYNWQQSADNSTWANAAGTRNAANYTTPALTTTMYYRRQAMAATCGGTITSASAKVTVTKTGSATIGSNSYSTYCYGGTIGCWMVQNSKEGTASYSDATYGKYYLWADRNGACVSPWTVPTETQWNALKTYINGSSATAAEKAMWFSGTALAGYYNGGTWAQKATYGYWWSSSVTYQYYNRGQYEQLSGPAVGYVSSSLPVRCIKN